MPKAIYTPTILYDAYSFYFFFYFSYVFVSCLSAKSPEIKKKSIFHFILLAVWHKKEHSKPVRCNKEPLTHLSFLQPHRCDQCPQTFNVEFNLTLHKSTHTTSDFTCPVCNKKFSRIASLKSHIMLHEKEEVGSPAGRARGHCLYSPLAVTTVCVLCLPTQHCRI